MITAALVLVGLSGRYYLITGYTHKARAAYTAGDFQEAAANYKKVLSFDGDNEKALNWLGYIYYGLRQDEKAIRTFEQALANNPDDYFARLYLGSIYLESGRNNKARAIFEAALIRHPEGRGAPKEYHQDYLFCLRLLSGLYEELGEEAEAEKIAELLNEISLSGKADKASTGKKTTLK